MKNTWSAMPSPRLSQTNTKDVPKQKVRAGTSLGLILVTLLLPACSWVFPFPEGKQGSPDSTAVSDLAQTLDRLLPKDSAVDVDRETGVVAPKLSCQEPVVVNLDSTPEGGLSEPALLQRDPPEGDILYAKKLADPRMFYRISRGEKYFSGNVWVPAKNEIPLLKDDPDFFQFKGTAYMIVATSGIPRDLEICSLTNSQWGACEPLQGLPSVELDGPAVINTTDGLQIIFNTADDTLSTSNERALSAKLFLANSPSANLITWNPEPSAILDEDLAGEDDAVLNHNGTILVYTQVTWFDLQDQDQGIKSALRYASRTSIDQTFSASHLLDLDGLESSKAYAPELRTIDETQLELFITLYEKDVDGQETPFIYRSICNIQN